MPSFMRGNTGPTTPTSPISKPDIVLPELVEEEAKFVRVDFYHKSKIKLTLFFVLSVLTVGLLPLICFWKPRIRGFFMYKKTTPKDSQYLVIENIDGTIEHITVIIRDIFLEDQKQTCKSFTYRLYEYYLDEEEEIYKPVQFSLEGNPYSSIYRKIGGGMSSLSTFHRRLITYGPNTMEIPKKSMFAILINEILSPFYIFQAFTIIYWAVFADYLTYALIILAASCLLLAIKFFKTKTRYEKLRQRAVYETELRVYRPSIEEDRAATTQIPEIVSSTHLVPGDLIEIPPNKKLPCDVILLSGACVMNESMLTGESALVMKSPLPKTDRKFDFWKANRHVLFSGTECVEIIKTDKEPQVIGVVIRTGFLTMKGRVIRSYLYSKEQNSKFHHDPLKYIGLMFCLGLISFFVNLPTLITQDKSAGDIILKFVNLVPVSVPPILPTSLSLGLLIVAIRLGWKKIKTKTEQKINMAGKVRIACFNKTGILTENFLDLYGIRIVHKTHGGICQLHPVIKDDVEMTLSTLNTKYFSGQSLLEVIASCHSIYKEGGTLKGDALDLKLFNSLGWTFHSNGNKISKLYHVSPPVKDQDQVIDSDNDDKQQEHEKQSSDISVIKRFAFSSTSQRISVISHKQGESKQRINIKGDPEIIKKLCLPETLPEDLDDALYQYTTRGFKVVACATRTIDRFVKTSENLAREYFERDLEFLGLLIFENKLKLATLGVIQHLTEADISSIMLTGDDPTTAIYTARQCGIIQKHQKVMLGSLEYFKDEESQLKWSWVSYPYNEGGEFEDLDSPRSKFDRLGTCNQFIINFPEIENNDYKAIENADGEGILEDLFRDNEAVIAITGDAFQYMLPRLKANKVQYQKFLQKTKVFAHSLPEDKALIIQELQYQGHTVAMCGDDVSDCRALQTANVSIALSESEGSIAASFVSKVNDISCLEHLLREGRCALVTIFQVLIYLSVYSLVQHYAYVILNANSSGMGYYGFLYQDIFLVLPTVLSVLFSKPTKRISKQRPTEYIFSVPVIMAVVGLCVIQIIFYLVTLWVLRSQEWYISPRELKASALIEMAALGRIPDPDVFIPDYDTTAVFLLGNLQYITIIMVFSTGRSFRQPFYKNLPFTIVFIVTLVINVILVLVKIPHVIKILQIRDFGPAEDFRWILFGIAAGNALATVVYERVVVPIICACLSLIVNRINKVSRLYKA